MKLYRLFLLVALALAGCAPAAAPDFAPAPWVDDAAAAMRQLEDARARALADRGTAVSERVRRLTRLGLWAAADSLLARSNAGPDVAASAAELRLRQHRYAEARELVARALQEAPRHRAARLAQAQLEVQAWRLERAEQIARRLLDEDRRDLDAALLLGRVALLREDYAGALEWAERAAERDPRSAGAHLLAADAHFWREDGEAAEAALARALSLDPLDADARFAYGYAIWRRRDASQLSHMAAQWELALALDPLHYRTHWHWGNGHTHLTYADYAEAADTVVRAALAPGDALAAEERIGEALDLVAAVQRLHPASVLPAVMRGSLFYLHPELPRAERLDSAQAAFVDALRRKPHYGPAHNGLAAVIKQRQFAELAAFDSLEAEIAATPPPRDAHFAAVFPDARNYPGPRVARMVASQLGPAAAYLPLIHRLGRTFALPPLHHDLARAMGRPYFRTATTFDNRQWMDIRGVGSGATGIEYVERGAHQERNVLLHEYVHLFHHGVLTDAEQRRVRELYHRAMEEGRTLDYYAANNESEFLAQAYPAFFAPVRVHPLNHKSMNTRDKLRRRDPATFAWVDSLARRQRAALAGDARALAGNWAQVYLTLAERVQRDDELPAAQRRAQAVALLDSALVWDRRYVPALLGRAALLREHGELAEAASWLRSAEAVQRDHAPTQAEWARLELARGEAGETDLSAALERADARMRRALQGERDLAERAVLSREWRQTLWAYGRPADAIRVADAYAAEGADVSTYLRDAREEAHWSAQALRAQLGYAAETLPDFERLVRRRPQNYTVRALYADALRSAGEADRARATLEEAYAILRAGGDANAAVLTRLAELRFEQGDAAAAAEALEPLLARDDAPMDDADALRLARVLLELGQTTEAHRRLHGRDADAEASAATPLARADWRFTRGWAAARRGDIETAETAWRAALQAHPYHRGARVALVRRLREAGRVAEADALTAEARRLPLPLGPEFFREAGAGRP